MRHFFLLIMLASIVYSCNQDNNRNSNLEADKAETSSDSKEGVSIELSLPHGHSLKYFGLCWDKNPVDVIIRNNTNSMIHFYENWNSWGYYNLHFKIETHDSLYTISRTRKVWFRNFPSYHSINPDESLVFHYNLRDSSCVDYDINNEKIKGYDHWTGFPEKEYDFAKIQVIYEIPEEPAILLNHRFRLRDSTESDTTFIFSKKLISKPVNIQILKEE